MVFQNLYYSLIWITKSLKLKLLTLNSITYTDKIIY